jgi:hypothetical protein
VASSGCRKAAFFVGIGCLSVVILFTITAAIVITMARGSLRRDTTAKREPLSVSIPTGAEGASGATKEAGQGEHPSGRAAAPSSAADSNMSGPTGPRDLPDPAVPGASPPPGAAPLALTLHLSEGIFTIRPGPAGSDIRVEGEYDPDNYALSQETEGDGTSEPGRRVTIRFKRKSMFSWGFNTDSTPNHVTVTIPEGVPTALDLRIDKARSQSELGGLTLTGLRGRFSTGEHKVSFERPLTSPVPSMSVTASMGRCDLIDIGNARPASFAFDGSMGDMRLDFEGAWPAKYEATAKLKLSMGNLRLSIPKEVRLSSSSQIMFGSSRRRGEQEETTDPEAPVLEMQAHVSMGDVVYNRP